MTQLLLILLSPLATIVLFIGTIATQFMASSAAQKGNFDKARKLGTLTFMGATLILAQNVAMAAIFRNALAIIMVALWAWIAWRDYKFVKSLPQKK